MTSDNPHISITRKLSSFVIHCTDVCSLYIHCTDVCVLYIHCTEVCVLHVHCTEMYLLYLHCTDVYTVHIQYVRLLTILELVVVGPSARTARNTVSIAHVVAGHRVPYTGLEVDRGTSQEEELDGPQEGGVHS